MPKNIDKITKNVDNSVKNVDNSVKNVDNFPFLGFGDILNRQGIKTPVCRISWCFYLTLIF